jgi:hypothetical protein
MRKKERRKLELHRESLRGLDLGAARGAAVTQVDCSFVITCTQAATCSAAAACSGNPDCTFVHTGCACTA